MAKLKVKIISFISGLSLMITPFCGVYAQDSEVVPEEPVETAIFTDVDVGHDEYVALKYLKEKGIIQGYADGSFKPDNFIARVEALKIILESNNLIDNIYIENNKLGGVDYKNNLELVSFSDIFKSQWYFPYLKKSVELGVVNGYPDGTFKPTDIVNRAESFKMVMESDGLEFAEVLEPPFADVSVNDWFAKYFDEAKKRLIVYVTMNNTVNPGYELTRSKFAELIYRYLRSKEGLMFGKGSYYADMFVGSGTSSGEIYVHNELTAAHRTLPFNTIVKVTNLENGNSVDVRINDRGPYITGRVIDLSRSAFETIAHPGQGVICVQYEIIKEA